MTPTHAPPGIIVLGASAGGLRSLEAVVSRLPADLAWPVLVSQHLQADRVSQMPEILARVASMPVREAVDGETPRAGTIYTCPSSSEMGLTIDGAITMRAPEAGRPQRIDHLFATASYARPGRTVAVVLSGTGTDGAVGAFVVKLNAGTVIAESDATALQSAMPAAAQRAGVVDVILPADAIAAVLHELAQGSMDAATAETDAIVADIAREITLASSTDFARYRVGTLRRQAEKRRAILGRASLSEYRDLVARDPAERDALVRNLLIPVTEFFRDPDTWRALEQQVVPVLAKRVRDGNTLRVWCAGCATGEEAYTIAMLLAECVTDRHRVRIVATDVDGGAIAAARRGVYDLARMRGVDGLRRERFFEEVEQGFRVTDDLRAMVDLRVHDVTRDDPPGKFDLIICRNLLIYFGEDLQEQTLAAFRSALSGPRVLFLGRSEAIQRHQDAFTPIARSMRIFRASGPEAATDGDAEGGEAHATAGASRGWSGANDVRVEEPDALVLILDETGRITAANGNAQTLLDGELVGRNLLDVFPRWQGSPVHDALRTSLATGRSLKVRGAPAPAGPMDVTLERVPGGARGTLLIATPASARALVLHDPEVEIAREDLEATNDELQSANEELAATNEELQATNEELATLNEEFQTTNQTLATTNVELGAAAKNARVASDLLNEFVETWREAIVACDGAGRVTVFNRRAAELFGLDASCIGRPVHLLPLGTSPGEIERWLDEAGVRPFKRAVDLHAGKHELDVSHVTTRSGTPLGWVLSWSPSR